MSGARGSRGDGRERRLRLPRAERLIPIAIVASAVILAASEFMVAFELTPPGAEPLREIEGADRHNYSLVILALFAIAAMLLALATGSQAAAYAVAAIGAVALLMFLVIDLPDAGQVGALEDLITARAEPQAGFWMQGLGALALAISGAVFATFDASALGGRRAGSRDGGADSGTHADSEEREEASSGEPAASSAGRDHGASGAGPTRGETP